MGLLDIFKGKKSKADEKLKRPKKGALKQPSSAKPVESSEVDEKGQAGTKEQSSELASRVILSPHITEKSSLLAEKGAYVFKVAQRANKTMIKRAVKELYGFKPKKVSTENVPRKLCLLRGKAGFKPGFKKALVYLKGGDKIDLT